MLILYRCTHLRTFDLGLILSSPKATFSPSELIIDIISIFLKSSIEENSNPFILSNNLLRYGNTFNGFFPSFKISNKSSLGRKKKRPKAERFVFNSPFKAI
jgi:hypothetical protein